MSMGQHFFAFLCHLLLVKLLEKADDHSRCLHLHDHKLNNQTLKPCLFDKIWMEHNNELICILKVKIHTFFKCIYYKAESVLRII